MVKRSTPKAPLRVALPTILLANVQSLDNKLTELRGRIEFQQETRNNSTLIFTETWLGNKQTDSYIALKGFSVHRITSGLKGRQIGGEVCIYIKNAWCRHTHTVSSHCSAELECLFVKCRPLWLPREFSAVILCAVYIHPAANTDIALKK